MTKPDWSQFEPVDPAVVPTRNGKTDWSQFAPVKPDDSSDTLRGFKESFQQLPQLGYGLLAGAGAAGEAAFGEGGIATGIKKAAVAGYQDWGNRIASKAKDSDSWDYSYDQAKQGNIGALVDWLQHGIGYVGGQGVQMLMTAGIGSVAGKFVAATAAKQIAEGMVAKSAAELAATEAGAKLSAAELTEAATANVAGKFAAIGQNSAVGAMGFGQEGGEIFGDLSKKSVDEGRSLSGAELGKAFAASLAAGALEFVGDKIGLDVILGKSALLKPAEHMGGIGGRLARGGIAAAAETPIEAGTEYLQTGLENYGKGNEENILPFNQSEAAQKDARESAMLGALGGSVIGGAGGMLHGAKQVAAPVPAPAVTPEAPGAPLAIGNTPDPLISFPDGTVGKKSDVDAYVAGLPPEQRHAARSKLMGQTPFESIADSQSVDEAIAAAAAAVNQPLELPDVDESALSPFMRRAAGVTQERDIAGIKLDADMAQQLQQREAEIDAIGGTAPEARAEFDAQQDALKRAATVEAPSAMELALRRAAPVAQDETPAAPAEPRIVARTPDMQPTSLAKAQAQADAAGGEVARVQNQSGKFAYVALPASQKEIQPGDLLTGDGKPYGSLIAAKVRARKDGGDVVAVTGGWLVRPKPAEDVTPIAPAVPAAAPAATTEATTDERTAVPASPELAGSDRSGSADAAGGLAADGRLDAEPAVPVPAGAAPAAGPVGDGGLGSRADDAAVAPAPKAPVLSTKANKDGTVMVLGKPSDIQAALPNVKGVAGKRGVMYGKRQAASVQKAVDAFNKNGPALVESADRASRSVESASNKSVPDVHVVGPQGRPDLLEGKTRLTENDSSVQVPVDRSVQHQVSRLGKDSEVRGGVVAPNLVDVVNVLGGQEGASNRLSGDRPMLTDQLAADANAAIPIGVDASASEVAGVSASKVAKGARKASPLSGDARAAVGAKDRDPVQAKDSATSVATEESAGGRGGELTRAADDGRATAGTLQDRHVVTPTSDGLLGAAGVSAPAAPPIVLDKSPAASPAPATQAAEILDAAAEPPKGKERLDVLKDVKAGAITPEEVKAAYPAKGAKIDDFGEKLLGARKDYAATLKDALNVDVAAEPLSKSWPEPDYQKLLDAGAKPFVVAWVHAARDQIPTKPMKGWKLSGWVATVKVLREASAGLLDGATTEETLRSQLTKPEFRNVAATVGGRADLYAAVGHEKSLKGINFEQHHYSVYRGETNVDKWVIDQKAKATAFGNWPREIVAADSKADAIAQFKAKVGTLETGSKAKAQPQFDIYRKRNATGAFIGKKIGREFVDLKKFADVAEARAYLADNKAALEQALAKYKETPFERNAENQPRVGDDHRNGAAVTPEVFADTFGFRGVQFGNYVEQGRRQSDLNQTFDALMDLAAVLGVPAKALSLGGRLGLAFGARGKGGINAPAAHFEPNNIVINLTKGDGPGSLAHEFWHGLDNYFARQGEGENSVNFVTGGAKTDGIREQMRAAFKAVQQATQQATLRERSAELDKRRSKPYWDTPVELSARAFESYVIAKLQDQNASNDYLANVVSPEFWDALEAMRLMALDDEGKTTYPYPMVDEMPKVRAAFDEFFQTVEAHEGEDGKITLAHQENAREDSPSEYGDPPAEESAKVEAGLKGKTLLQAADWIAEHAPAEMGLIVGMARKQIARLQLAGAEFSFKIAHVGDSVPRLLMGARGITNYSFGSSAGKGKIDVWLNGADVNGKVGVSYETASHEIIHAGTMAAIRLGNFKSQEGTPLAQHVSDLYAVTNYVRAEFNKRVEEHRAGTRLLTPFEMRMFNRQNNAFADANETVTWALTNKDAQTFLESIEYKGKTAWTAFVQVVRSLLGLSPKADTALSEILRISEELLNDETHTLTEGMLSRDGKDTVMQRGMTDITLPQDSITQAHQSTGPAAGQPSYRDRIADKLRNAGGGPKIIGNTGRAYTPTQLAAMRAVGFQVQAPTLEDRAKAVWKDAGKKLAQGLVDQFAPIKEISSDAYSLLRLAKGASGAFEAMLQGGKLKLSDGVYDFDETQRGGVVDTLLKPLGGEHHDFFRWVAANRAERLLGEGKEHLFTPDDIKALKTLADGTASFDYEIQHGAKAGTKTRDRSLIYADALKTFNGFNKNVLDLAEQSGLIDGESRKLWEHEFYVPFYRVAEDEGGGIGGVNIKGGAVRQQAFKQLKGGKQALNADLMDNTLMNWAHLLDASAKNRAAVATLAAAENMGVAISAPESTAREMASSISQKGNVVWVMDGGQKHFYVVEDPYVMTALTSLEYAGMRSPIMKALGTFKHALTLGVTASPFFKVRNLIRDSVQAIGSAPLSYNVAQNLAEGWKLTDPKSDAYFRLLAGGGTIHFGTQMEGSEGKRVQALVEAGVDASTILDGDQKVKAFYRKFIEPSITAYNELGNRGEAINRAALYAQLRKQGMNHMQASLQARDLMDFSMQGSFNSVRFLTQVVPFFNARLQGLYKLGRAAKEDPARISTVIGAAALAGLGLMLAYSDDDDWRKREDWDKNNFWWFKFGGMAFRIPKPFEVGAIATLAERGFEYAFDKEMDGKRFRTNVLALLSDNLSMNPIPQLAKPLLDVYANKDGFTGRPIETMGMEKLKADYRFTSHTSMAARGISTAANAVTGLVGAQTLSPVQVDSLLRGYFGWLGSFVVGAGDVIARPLTGQATQPDSDLFKAATGGMLSDLRDAPSRYVSQVYAQATEIEQAYTTWKSLAKEGKTEEAAEFLADNKADISKYKLVEKLKKTEGTLNQQIKRIEQGGDSGQTKRERIRDLLARKDQVARVLAGT